MRVFITTTVPNAREVFSKGFTDLHSLAPLSGVAVGSTPLGINDGVEDEHEVALEVPPAVYSQYELIDDPDGTGGQRTGQALIPAAVLNQYGKPQIYDHEYAGISRRDMLRTEQRWREHGEAIAAGEAEVHDESCRAFEAEQVLKHAATFRAAIEFFDEIGWLTPLKLQEQGAD